MPVVVSDQATLTLHAVRLLGFADTARVAFRFRQSVEEARERLLDFEAVGWVSHSEFGGTAGWSMTASGRAEGQRRLASELDRNDLRFVVSATHRQFLTLNARFLKAATGWQVRMSRVRPWHPTTTATIVGMAAFLRSWAYSGGGYGR